MNLLNVKIEDVLKTLPGSIGVGNEIRYRIVHHYLPRGSGLCLDAGCGPNPASRMFPYIRDLGYEPVGLDSDPNKGPDVTYGDITKMPFPNEHFNAIVSLDSLYVDPTLAFREFHRVLKKGGVTVIHAPLPGNKQHHVLQYLIDEIKKEMPIPPRKQQEYEKVHRQWYDYGELKKIGQETGFSHIEEIKSWGFYESVGYDIRYIAGLIEKDQERIRQISVIAWLITLLEDLSEPKERFTCGLITRMIK